MMVLFFSCCQV